MAWRVRAAGRGGGACGVVGDARRSVDETRSRRARAALLKEEKAGEKHCQWVSKEGQATPWAWVRT